MEGLGNEQRSPLLRLGERLRATLSGEGSLSVLHELKLLREVGVDDVAEAVPRESLLLALLLYFQEGVELFVPHLVGVPRVLLELVEPLDVYLGQLVGGKFVLYDVRVVKNQPPHAPHKRV